MFFYINNELVGYSVVSGLVENNCFKYVIRKMEIKNKRNICLYIDYKTFENLYYIYDRDFYINWGASKGNVLKYKKKFPVSYEGRVWFYKIKSE